MVLARRRQATITGRCACGAVMTSDGAMTHGEGCPVADALLVELLRRHRISREDIEFEAVVGDAGWVAR